MATGCTPRKDIKLLAVTAVEDKSTETSQFHDTTVEVYNPRRKHRPAFANSSLVPLNPPTLDLLSLDVTPYFHNLKKSVTPRSLAFDEWKQNKHLIRDEILYQFCLDCYHAMKHSPPVDLSKLDHYWAGFFKGVALERTLSLNDTLSNLLSKFEPILHQSNLYTELQSLLNTQVISITGGEVVMTKATLERLEAGISKLEALLSKMGSQNQSNLPLPVDLDFSPNSSLLPYPPKKPRSRRK